MPAAAQPETCPQPALGPPGACLAPEDGDPVTSLAPDELGEPDPGPALWVGAVFGLSGLAGIVFATGRVRDQPEGQR